MPERVLTEIWGWIVVAFGIAGAWWRGEYRDRQTRADLVKLTIAHETHLRECRSARYITEMEHEKMQAGCQGRILAELAHIRELIENRLARMEKDIEDLKRAR